MTAKHIDPLLLSDCLETKGLFLGTNVATDKGVYLKHETLQTKHVHLVGPPGKGKTVELLHLFEIMAQDPDAIPIVFDPKPWAPLATACRDYCIDYGLTKRLTLFDLSDLRLGYEPLAPNGVPPSLHAKQVREALRSAHGMTSLDDTRQLARFLFYGLFCARLFDLGITGALDLMWPGSPLRRKLLAHVSDPRLKMSLEYVERLSASRQDQLIASTLAMLESFISDPYIQRMLTLQPRLDLAKIMDEKRILLINMGAKNPLSWDDVRILGRLLINDILSHVFSRKDRTPRVYLFVDECHLLLSHDLCKALDLGRELGLTCLLSHQRLKQLEQEDET